MESVIRFRVKPGAGRNRVLGMDELGIVHVEIKERPQKGKANRELIRFLARLSGIDKERIRIKSGLTSRDKRVAFEGMDRETVLSRIIR